MKDDTDYRTQDAIKIADEVPNETSKDSHIALNINGAHSDAI